jgi:hypothetical protein
MKNYVNKEGRVSRITQQGVFIKLIKDGKETEQEYFAHLGDIHENEKLLYDLRDHKLNDLETVYNHFVKLEEDQEVKFKVWNENEGNKLDAFNVSRK